MLREVLERTGRKAPVYLIGIGGVGVSGLARLFRAAGHDVSGSDAAASPLTEELEAIGVRVHLGPPDAGRVPADAALVVHTAAVCPDHEEMEAARRHRIPTLKYAEVLGRLMAERRGIAVAGTHGKTTTTAMIAHILLEGGLDPSVVVGGSVPRIGGTSRAGGSDILVAEACEYDRSFLNLHPTYAVITNVEPDHLDYYEDLDEIVSAFACFARLVPPRGRLFVGAASAPARRAVEGAEAPVETYGVEVEADWEARDVDLAGGEPRYTLVRRGEALGRVVLKVPGRHNVEDSVAAAAVASALGVPIPRIRVALAGFTAVKRRFQVVCERAGTTVVDDYAHHPTEIAATLAAARDRYPGARLVVLFQPHQHARTRHLREGFVEALAAADRVLLADIYGARETEAERASISSFDLVRDLAARRVDAHYLADLDLAGRFIARESRRGDVVLVLGAGDVYKVAQALRDLLGEREEREDREEREAAEAREAPEAREPRETHVHRASESVS